MTLETRMTQNTQTETQMINEPLVCLMKTCCGQKIRNNLQIKKEKQRQHHGTNICKTNL